MADSRTSVALKRVTRMRAIAVIGLGVAIGLVARIWFDFRPIEPLIQSIGPAANFLPKSSLESLQRDHFTGALLGWVAGPVIGALSVLALAKLPPVARQLERHWRGPPSFVRSDIAAERKRTVTHLEQGDIGLIGRERELQQLTAMGRSDFAWRFVLGSSGIGKTRLALEWLARLQGEGWDVGVVDRADAGLIRDWKARRPTALIIDEAGADWLGDQSGAARLGELLDQLASGATSKARVRVLVLDQDEVSPYADRGDQRERVEAGRQSALRLQPMGATAIRAFCDALGHRDYPVADVLEQSGGRPRAALILLTAIEPMSLARATRQWAERVLPELQTRDRIIEPQLAEPLIWAALAGPVSATLVRPHRDYSALALIRFFPGATRDLLEQALPALEPRDLADELVLRLLSRTGAERRATILTAAIGANPQRAAARIAAIWRARVSIDDSGALAKGQPVAGDHPDELSIVWQMQRSLDATLPGLADQRRQHAQSVQGLLFRKETGSNAGESIVDALHDLARGAPHDDQLWYAYAAAVTQATLLLENRERDGAILERLLSRLAVLGQTDRFGDDPVFRTQEIRALHHAVLLSPRSRLADAERHQIGVIAIADQVGFLGNAGIQRWAAESVLALLDSYRRENARLVERHERWFAYLQTLLHRLAALGEDIRDLRLRGLVNRSAILSSPDLADVAAFRKVAQELLGQASRSNPGHRKHLSLLAVNASFLYSHAHTVDASEVERWSVYLLEQGADGRSVPVSAVNAMKFAVSASMACLNLSLEQDLLRWVRQTLEFRPQPIQFADEHALLALKAVTNASHYFSQIGDHAKAEQWGSLGFALFAEGGQMPPADFALYLAYCAGNILIAAQKDTSGRGKVELWRTRLAIVAQIHRFDLPVQGFAHSWGLGFTDQEAAGFPYGVVDDPVGSFSEIAMAARESAEA